MKMSILNLNPDSTNHIFGTKFVHLYLIKGCLCNKVPSLDGDMYHVTYKIKIFDNRRNPNIPNDVEWS